MKAGTENIQSLLNESLPISQLAFVALHGKGSLVLLLTSMSSARGAGELCAGEAGTWVLEKQLQ